VTWKIIAIIGAVIAAAWILLDFYRSGPCPYCDGDGAVAGERCEACEGYGR